jgi:hypothetical protein
LEVSAKVETIYYMMASSKIKEVTTIYMVS